MGNGRRLPPAPGLNLLGPGGITAPALLRRDLVALRLGSLLERGDWDLRCRSDAGLLCLAERGAHVRVVRGDLIAGVFRGRPSARVLDLLRGVEGLLLRGRDAASGAGGGGRRLRSTMTRRCSRNPARTKSGCGDDEHDEGRRAKANHAAIIAQTVADWSNGPPGRSVAGRLGRGKQLTSRRWGVSMEQRIFEINRFTVGVDGLLCVGRYTLPVQGVGCGPSGPSPSSMATAPTTTAVACKEIASQSGRRLVGRLGYSTALSCRLRHV